jgi:arylsulfatase A-like enzyme
VAVAHDGPNVLMVVCHDLGRELGCYGVPGLATPHLDALAADGVGFRRCFATAPLCSPSRGSLLTGCYPHTNGLMGLVNRGWDMPDGTPTLADLFGGAGYETWLFGFHHEKRDPRRMGYAHLVATDGPYRADHVLPQVSEFLRQRPAEPFLAVVGLGEAHRPFRRPPYQADDPATVAVPPYLPDDPRVREDLAAMHGLVRAVDRAFAEVLDALATSGLEGRTLVVFTTDHGIAFPRAKSTLYDPGIGTTLLLRWPGVLPRGAWSDALVSLVDVLPTLLEGAGLPVPAHVQGRSFWRCACEPQVASAPRDAIFAEKTWHDAYDPKRAIRTDRWKYIRNFEPGPELVLPADIAASPSAQVPEVVAATERPRPPEELYDLERDPTERHNLAADPTWAAVRDALRDRLAAWMAETDDPLCRGPVPEPADGVR